jgi:hypothetical protein
MPALTNRIAALERAAAAAPSDDTLAAWASEVLPRLAERARVCPAARALQGRMAEWSRVRLPLLRGLQIYLPYVPDAELEVMLDLLRQEVTEEGHWLRQEVMP